MLSDDIQEAKHRLGPMADLLGRHGHHPKGKRVRCPSPIHEDKNPSASLYVAFDGDERVRCWACGYDGDIIDVARLFGEQVALQRLGIAKRRRQPRSSTSPLEQQVLRLIAFRAEFPVEWEVAKTLALVSRDQMRVEVLRNWEFLTAHLDVDVLLVTYLADVIRGVALLRFGNARELDPRWSDEAQAYVPSDGMARAVKRLAEAVSPQEGRLAA